MRSTARRCGPGTRSASAPGAWALDKDAPEATRGFLLNHLIDELLPPKGDGRRWANSDPITGQAAWFDLAGVDPNGIPTRPTGSASPMQARKQPGRTGAGQCGIRTGESPMTSLPQTTEKRLGLVIDLDTCVGCHACVVNCKEWNTGAMARRWPMSTPMAPTCPVPG
jgi:NAD-dependent dihydropyrimidine dehydrogenase PreA subunit